MRNFCHAQLIDTPKDTLSSMVGQTGSQGCEGVLH